MSADLKELFLSDPRLTLAVAESLTCGRVQAGIGAISGASDFFMGGVTAYSIEQKVKLLGVDRAHAEEVNAVSERVAREMAAGAGELFGSDLGVTTTGYAEPSPERKISVPMAWWAVCHRQTGGGHLVFSSGSVEIHGRDRMSVQQAVADAALAALADYLRQWRRR